MLAFLNAHIPVRVAVSRRARDVTCKQRAATFPSDARVHCD
jgi:hypothetical protein